MVEELIPRLEVAHQTVDELVKVFDTYGKDKYDREKAYTDEIDHQVEENRKKLQDDAAKREARAQKNETKGGQSLSGVNDSIGGNCKTSLLACLSPSQSFCKESNNTLMFAHSCKAI